VCLQAFLIAFTSEFLPRLLYQYQYDWDLKGYTNFTLATSPNGTLQQECRYSSKLSSVTIISEISGVPTSDMKDFNYIFKCSPCCFHEIQKKCYKIIIFLSD